MVLISPVPDSNRSELAVQGIPLQTQLHGANTVRMFGIQVYLAKSEVG